MGKSEGSFETPLGIGRVRHLLRVPPFADLLDHLLRCDNVPDFGIEHRRDAIIEGRSFIRCSFKQRKRSPRQTQTSGGRNAAR